MLRRFALLTLLALACIAVVACGDDSASPSTTPGGSSASITPADNPTATADPGTPTPVPSTTVWQIGGQIAGNPNLSVLSCGNLPGYYQVVLTGDLNGTQINVDFFTPHRGTLDFASAETGMTVYAALSSVSSPAASSLWFGSSGKRGVQGTVVIGPDGAGSMSGILVPPAESNAGSATANITLAGEWKCPPLFSPTP